MTRLVGTEIAKLKAQIGDSMNNIQRSMLYSSLIVMCTLSLSAFARDKEADKTLDGQPADSILVKDSTLHVRVPVSISRHAIGIDIVDGKIAPYIVKDVSPKGPGPRSMVFQKQYLVGGIRMEPKYGRCTLNVCKAQEQCFEATHTISYGAQVLFIPNSEKDIEITGAHDEESGNTVVKISRMKVSEAYTFQNAATKIKVESPDDEFNDISLMCTASAAEKDKRPMTYGELKSILGNSFSISLP